MMSVSHAIDGVPPSEHLQRRGLNPLSQNRMQAAPGHYVGFAPEKSGGRVFHVHQREEPKRAFGMIEEQIDIGIVSGFATRSRTEQ